MDLARLSRKHNAFNDVLHLSHIAGPGISAEKMGDLFRKFLDAPAMFAVKMIKEMHGKKGDVVPAVTESDNREVEYIKPVI
jgi:hypothetical protein